MTAAALCSTPLSFMKVSQLSEAWCLFYFVSPQREQKCTISWNRERINRNLSEMFLCSLVLVGFRCMLLKGVCMRPAKVVSSCAQFRATCIVWYKWKNLTFVLEENSNMFFVVIQAYQVKCHTFQTFATSFNETLKNCKGKLKFAKWWNLLYSCSRVKDALSLRRQ